MGLGPLVGILAELYPEGRDARRLAQEARLDIRRINFSGTAMQFWSSTLVEADHQDRIGHLFDVARIEYPGNLNLETEISAYFIGLERAKYKADSRYVGEDDIEVVAEERLNYLEREMRSMKSELAEMSGTLKSLNALLSQSSPLAQTPAAASTNGWIVSGMLLIIAMMSMILYMLANSGGG